jgi:hypothetical protein
MRNCCGLQHHYLPGAQSLHENRVVSRQKITEEERVPKLTLAHRVHAWISMDALHSMHASALDHRKVLKEPQDRVMHTRELRMSRPGQG